ncbi:hypothetical protein [Cupriavidus sp. DL-D2]|uniref:hypothetical protein n=1 Tax=Cupriavidus sp. DL-D2 TaxID=3144974 RepID=UPI00321398E4
MVNEDMESLEQLVRDYKEGRIRGLVLTYERDDGKPVHKVMGEYADDLTAAASQVRRLDLALNRHFFSDHS